MDTAESADAPPVKVKQEKDDADEPVATGGEFRPPPVKLEDAVVKEEVHIKSEPRPDQEIRDGGVKDEQRLKHEDQSVKNEGQPVKHEGIKREEVGDSVKDEAMKREGDADMYALAKSEQFKSEQFKNEQFKNEQFKNEQLKNEQLKSERVKNEGDVKRELKKERSQSRKKKDKKKKDKIKKERRSGSRNKKDKKKKRSKSPDGPRKRKSKWGPDTGGFSMTAIPARNSGLMPLPHLDDFMPKFNEDELVMRTVVLDNLSLSVTGQELIEFFNGAVLAVTANAVQQAANRSMAPVFACTVTEEDRGHDDKRKSAELKFRTPEGASVGMKLSGIEYKGSKVVIKRPENFPRPEDGLDPSSKINLQDMSMARLVGGDALSGKSEHTGPSPKLSIFNLPEVMSEQICRDLLSQFGKLRMLSLIRDLATGKIKGYGIFEYDDPGDAELAIIALNGFVCGQNVIRVQKLGGAAQQAQPKPQPVAATAMSNSMTQKIVSNPVLAMQVKQGREVGSRPSSVVQLLNAVYQEDLMDDQDYEDIMAEVHTEASKHGTVTRVVIPKPAKDGSFVDGVGKIFVAFQDLTAARKFQMDANGRKFENRVVCSAFYPIDKFGDAKYKLWST